jgi:hypothetical protein
MSRLDQFILRLEMQRTLLDHACALLNELGEAMPGPVIELGLGNGRTFDHMRAKLPGRRIVAFGRELHANPKSLPPPGDFILGDIRSTGPAFAEEHGPIAALLHADLGNGVPADDRVLEVWLPGIVHSLLRPGGQALCSTRLVHERLRPLAFPSRSPKYEYYYYEAI